MRQPTSLDFRPSWAPLSVKRLMETHRLAPFVPLSRSGSSERPDALFVGPRVKLTEPSWRREGAAGSSIESVSKLRCAIDPNEIMHKAGAGAQCSFETGQ